MHGCNVPNEMYAVAIALVFFALWLIAMVADRWKTPSPRAGRLIGAFIALAISAPLWVLIHICRTWP